MLFNHDFYKPHTDLTYFSKFANFETREDTPITFLPVNGGKITTLIKAASDGPGLQGVEFNNSMGVETFSYGGSSYKMIYHRKDGGVSWDGYDALISSITTPIDVSDYNAIEIHGTVYTNNPSLNYSLFVSLTEEVAPERTYGANYDFTGWKEFLTGDYTVASTNIQVEYNIKIPISELTDLTGPLYFNYAVRHNQNISAYSVYTGIKDLIFIKYPEY